MTEQQSGLILLIKSALTGERYDLPSDFDVDTAFVTARAHGITSLIYYGACNCGLDKSSDAMKKAFATVCQSVMADEKQRAEIAQLMRAFDDNSIKYMPLKGVNLKALYPHPEMRMMGDADILISPEQYPDVIRPLMIELGYEEGAESDHELIWNKPSLHVELHKRLIPSYNKDYYAYFGDGWTLAKKKSQSSERYGMTDEDELIYLFTHFAKHYRDSGIGLRHMVDLWVFKSHHPEIDREYIREELHKLQLNEFFCNIERTLNVWFDSKQGNEITDFITQVIFKSGQYGKKQVSVVSSALKESKSEKSAKKIKFHQMFRSAFQKIDYLKVYYPILDKLPVLLPFIWIVHFFRRVFTKNKLKNYVKNINQINDDKISEYQRDLNFVGLDFNFK